MLNYLQELSLKCRKIKQTESPNIHIKQVLRNRLSGCPYTA